MRPREFVVLIEKDEDGILVATVPALTGCHTQAKTLPQLLDRVKEAIRLCLKVQKVIPEPLKFVGLKEIEI